MSFKETIFFMLGHSTTKITSDTYTHVLKKHKAKSIDILYSLVWENSK